MKTNLSISIIVSALAFSGCATPKPEMIGNLHQELSPESFYLPNEEASRVVSVTTNQVATANLVVQT